MEDIFDLQDQVTASVMGAIAPKLEQAEIERAKRKPTESLDAYDYYLRGMASIHLGTRQDTTRRCGCSTGRRARSVICLRLWHGSLVLRLAQGKWWIAIVRKR